MNCGFSNQPDEYRHIWITGVPGSGKTTLHQKIWAQAAQILPNTQTVGFFTQFSTRAGFKKTLRWKAYDGSISILVAVEGNGFPKMKAEKNGFKQATAVMEQYSAQRKLFVVDELGFLEQSFPEFQYQVFRLIDECWRSIVVMRNMQSRFFSDLKSRKDSWIINVSPENRDTFVCEVQKKGRCLWKKQW